MSPSGYQYLWTRKSDTRINTVIDYGRVVDFEELETRKDRCRYNRHPAKFVNDVDNILESAPSGVVLRACAGLGRARSGDLRPR